MDPRSARALLSVSFILLVVAGMIGSPSAGLVAAGLAALCALPAVFVGTRGVKIVGALMMLASVGAAIVLLPASKEDLDRYRKHSLRPTAPAAPAPSSDPSTPPSAPAGAPSSK